MVGDADIATIMATGDFDVAAVFTRAAGGTVSVRGWFTDKTQQTNLLTQEVETVDASVLCVSSQITTVKTKDTVVINGTTYQVNRLEKLGTGYTQVYLKS